MDAHWLEIGRDLVQKSVGLGKQDRLALVRQRAHALGRSPHSVGRFLALADFLAPFEIERAIQERLPLGVIEVIHRVHLKDPLMARAMLGETIEKGMTYRDALNRMADLVRRIEAVDENRKFQPGLAVRKEIVDRLGMYTVAELEFVCLGGYRWCLSSVSSSWKVADTDIGLISEADKVYSFSRGFRNFARNIFLAKNEYDHILVEFVSRASWKQFYDYCSMIKKSPDLVVKLYGLVDEEITPDRKAWAHLTKTAVET